MFIKGFINELLLVRSNRKKKRKKKIQYKFGTSKNEIDMVNDFAIRVFNRIKFMPNDKFH